MIRMITIVLDCVIQKIPGLLFLQFTVQYFSRSEDLSTFEFMKTQNEIAACPYITSVCYTRFVPDLTKISVLIYVAEHTLVLQFFNRL